MLKKNLLIPSVLLSSLLISGCASTPPDVPICMELSPTRGWCTYTIKNQEFEISEDKPHTFTEGQKPMTWWELRPTFIYVPSPSWAKLKAWIIKTCKATNQCDKAIGSWQRKIDEVDSRIEERKE